TVGSAVPHAVNSVGGIQWRGVVLLSSMQALAGALIVAFAVREGPFAMPQSRLDFSPVTPLIPNPRFRLGHPCYLGHMWELYSMWGWIAVILGASAGWPRMKYESGAALAIAIGLVGCVWAGVASDQLQDRDEGERVGQRARVTIIAMAASAACCILA